MTGSGSYKGSLLTLHPLNMNASGNSLSGSVVADLSGAVPAINAAFAGQTLNLDALLAKPGARACGHERQRRQRREAGWSDAKIDFSALRAVTAKLKLTAGQLIYNNIKIGKATLQATIAGGKLAARCRASSSMTARARRRSMSMRAARSPAQRIRLSLANFDAYPFLKDSCGI